MFTVIPPENKSVFVSPEHGDHGDHGRYDRRDSFLESDGPYRSAERVKDSVTAGRLELLNQIGNTVTAVDRNGRSAELATEKIGAAGQLSVEKIGAANQLATERTAAAVAVANAKDFANTQNLLISGFKDGRYDAAVNQAASMAALAECCCELRTAIAKEGSDTRELMSSIDARRADRELVDAKNETVLLKLQLSQRGQVPA